MRLSSPPWGLIVAGALLLACASVATGSGAGPFGPAHMVNAGFVGSPASESLAAWWIQDRSSHTEHAFCVTKYEAAGYPNHIEADSVFRVMEAEPAPTVHASEFRVYYHCDDSVPTIHSHGQQEGMDNCSPSRLDYRSLWASHAPFAAVQCDERAFSFYWPDPRER